MNQLRSLTRASPEGDAGAASEIPSVEPSGVRLATFGNERSERVLEAQAAVIESLRSFKRETTAVFAHDLKNPLSAIMMNLDFALAEIESTGSNPQVAAALEDCRMAVTRAFRMLTDMLDVARSDDGALLLDVATFDARAMLDKLATERAVDARARHITLACVEVASIEPVLVRGDIDLLERALDNVLECALRLTRPAGRIQLHARTIGDGRVQLLVQSDAPAMQNEFRARLLADPAPSERMQKSPAAVWNQRGFGLYFARLVAKAHDIDLALEAEQAFPTSFILTFP